MRAGPDPQEIRSLFSSIAHGYDRANDVMTFGLARLWRRQLVEWSGAKVGDQILDCATGTGDLALEFKRAVGEAGRVVGTDFCEEMLKLAPAKAEQAELKVEFAVADAMALPYPDQSFDVVSIAYGIRNVADPLKALSEMARVCKPDGRIMILETGDSQWPLLQRGMRWYFSSIVPRLGGWITGKPQAYEYLSRSSAAFPSREKFLDLMRQTGMFSKVEFRTLMGGASFIYCSTKS